MLLLYLYFYYYFISLNLLCTVNQFGTHFRYCVSAFSYKHMPQCKFSLYLKKAGLASRNIVHFLKKSFYVVSVFALIIINHTLWGGTYLYSLYRGVPPPPGIFFLKTSYLNLKHVYKMASILKEALTHANVTSDE